MAAVGFTPILVYSSTVASNTPPTIQLGELAVNIHDGKIFIGTGVNTYTTLYDPSNVAIIGGAINGVVIGGLTPAAGHFTAVSATGAVTVASLASSGAVSGTTGAFTGAVSAVGLSSSSGLTVSSGTSALQAVTGTTGNFSGSLTAASLAGGAATGAGASGTWGVSISGNAATATNSANLGGVAAASYQQTSGSFGVGQTWQNVTGSRASGVTYTNSTGKPILVSIWAGGDSIMTFYVNGAQVGLARSSGNYLSGNGNTFVVPNGSTYQVTGSNLNWAELR